MLHDVHVGLDSHVVFQRHIVLQLCEVQFRTVLSELRYFADLWSYFERLVLNDPCFPFFVSKMGFYNFASVMTN